jgi:polyisoprenoid-binding protein YceI
MRHGTWLVPSAHSRAKEKHVTIETPGARLETGGSLRPAAGSWRVNRAHSHATFAARVAGRAVRGRLPLTGQVLIAEPVEHSTARLAARADEVSTGSAVLDRLLAGAGFLDAAAFPEITFRSELLAWVPAGWRAVGRLRVKGAEHELACRIDLVLGGPPPGLRVVGRWVIDARWITRQWIPALGRRIPMTCSFLLAPDG